MPSGLVTRQTLIARLGMSMRACKQWQHDRLLVGQEINVVTHYTVAVIEAFLVWEGNPDDRPSWHDISKRRVTLLTPEAAYRRYGASFGVRTLRNFRRLITDGMLGGYFKVNRYIRLVEELIEQEVGKRHGLLSRRVAEWIFGCGPALLLYIMRSHDVKQVRLEDNERVIYYRLTDVTHVLRLSGVLPDWLTAEMWISHILSAQRAPLMPSEVQLELGVNEATYRRLVRRRDLLFITLRSGSRRISPLSVRNVFLSQPILTPQDIGHIFGATAYEVTNWLQDGELQCDLHSHADDLGYRHACMVPMLAPLLSPGLSAQRWLMGRRMTMSPPTPESVLLQRHGMSREQLADLASKGSILGLRRPDGQWVFRAEVTGLSRAKVRQLVQLLPGA